MKYSTSYIEKYMKSFSTALIRNVKLSFLLGFAILAVGFYALYQIPKESAPNVEFGVVNISTAYPGVSAPDIDTLVTEKIESKIQSISTIKKYTSTSQNSFSTISVEFDPGVDMVKSVSDIRSKVDEAKGELPSDLENDPRILEVDSSVQPFIQVILYGDYDKKLLSETAEKLKLQIESLPGVATVNLSGNADTEIHINIDKNKLEAYGLSLNDVQSAIRSAHRDTPLGEIEIDDLEYTLRFQGKLETQQDVENVAIKRLGGNESTALVKISDIADVIQTVEDTNTITRFSPYGQKSMNAITISVSKAKSKDIFATNTVVQNAVQQFIKAENIDGLKYTFSSVSADIMKKDFDTLFFNMTSSVGIVMILIFLFIGFRQGLITAMVIPLSFLGTIAALYFSGKTLNFMTNFSMILALGILVDTAIVVVEGATDFIKKGYSSKEAAILSFLEFRAPLISGMSTTLVVFLVLFFLPGIMGKYLSYIPITVTYVLSISLFVSLFLIASYASVLLKPNIKQNHLENEKNNIPKGSENKEKGENLFQKGIKKYKEILSFIIDSPRRRWIIFGGVLMVFFLTFFLPSKFELMPSSDSDSLTITIEKPVGTRSENTLVEVKKIEDFLMENNYIEIDTIRVDITANIAKIFIELLPQKERKAKNLRTSKDLEYEFIDQLPHLTHDIFKVVSKAKGPPSQSPIGFRVIMENPSDLKKGEKVTKELVSLVQSIEGTQGVTDTITQIPGEIRFTVNREKALKLGIPPEMVSTVVRTAVYGSKTATISNGNQDIDIVVQYDDKELSRLQDIQNIMISPNIRLSSVADISYETALSSISRYNGKLMFRVSSFLTKDGNTQEITNEVLNRLNKGAITLPEGVKIEDASENAENKDLIMAFAALGSIAIFLMFLILVIQFDSFAQPLLILQTIIFAQIGVSIGLFLTGTPHSLPWILGIISLAGIVVNDAIIMVDQMNKNIRSGKFSDKFEAIATAGSSRFIPVVLTTLTTSAGVLPLIFVDAFWAGLAYTIVFGLMVATIMTLFLIPVGYTLFWSHSKKTVPEKNLEQ